MRSVFLLLLMVAAMAIGLTMIASQAEQRIAQRIPARAIDVNLIRMTVDWEDLDWLGIQARKASLNVPYAAAIGHFMSGTPVSAGTVSASDAVLDLSHETLRPLTSTLVLGGYTAPTLTVRELLVQAEAIDGGYRVVRSDVRTDIGTFAYTGDLVNGRPVNGTLVLTGATPAMEGLMVTMTRLSGGREQREDGGVRLIFP
jgi:hypothetical protein